MPGYTIRSQETPINYWNNQGYNYGNVNNFLALRMMMGNEREDFSRKNSQGMPGYDRNRYSSFYNTQGPNYFNTANQRGRRGSAYDLSRGRR